MPLLIIYYILLFGDFVNSSEDGLKYLPEILSLIFEFLNVCYFFVKNIKLY